MRHAIALCRVTSRHRVVKRTPTLYKFQASREGSPLNHSANFLRLACPVIADMAPNGSKLGAEKSQVFSCEVDATRLGFAHKAGKCRVDATERASCRLMKRKPSSTCLYPRQVSASRLVERLCSLSSSSPTERTALQYLVVPVHLDAEMSGATTGCTTIRPLVGYASLVTARSKAPTTMYPHFCGVGFTRVNR